MKAYIQILWLATWETVLCDEVSPIKERHLVCVYTVLIIVSTVNSFMFMLHFCFLNSSNISRLSLWKR